MKRLSFLMITYFVLSVCRAQEAVSIPMPSIDGDTLMLVGTGFAVDGKDTVSLRGFPTDQFYAMTVKTCMAGDFDSDGTRDICIGWNEDGIGYTKFYFGNGDIKMRTHSATLMQLLNFKGRLAAITVNAGLYCLVRFSSKMRLWHRLLPLYFNHKSSTPLEFWYEAPSLRFRDNKGAVWYNKRGKTQRLMDRGS